MGEWDREERNLPKRLKRSIREKEPDRREKREHDPKKETRSTLPKYLRPCPGKGLSP